MTASVPRPERAAAAAFPLTLFLSFEQLLRIVTAGKSDDPADIARAGREARARTRVRHAWDAHLEAGGDPSTLSGPVVARSTGVSVRRAQELLAELRASASRAPAAANGHGGAR